MRNFCRELADKHKVEIDFREENIPGSISHEISLCLFRVLQEAVHNAAKHSGVRRFEAALGCSTGRSSTLQNRRYRSSAPHNSNVVPHASVAAVQMPPDPNEREFYEDLLVLGSIMPQGIPVKDLRHRVCILARQR